MLPTGFTDQANTIATLITRPSRWFGTIACRRLPVLMLKRMPRPMISAQSATAPQYQVAQALGDVAADAAEGAPLAHLRTIAAEVGADQHEGDDRDEIGRGVEEEHAGRGEDQQQGAGEQRADDRGGRVAGLDAPVRRDQ